MAAPTDPEAFAKALQGEYVVIIANPGSYEQRLTVSKGIICSRSKYFEKVFNGDFGESQQKKVELQDIDATALQTALYCTYHDSIPDDYKTMSENDAHAHLVNTWLVADRLLLPTVQNRTVEALCHRLLGKLPYEHLRMRPYEELDTALIRVIYANTAPRSMLRKLAWYNVAAYVVSSKHPFPGRYAECFEKLEDFGLQVCSAIRQILADSDTYAVDMFLSGAAFETSSFWMSEE